MTLPTSGTLSLDAINTEFNLGRNLGAYRGVRWYKDDNSRGFFDNNSSGNGPPTDFSEFYGTRKTIPVTPTGDVSYGNGSYFTVPFYNRLIIKLQGGSGGSGGGAGNTWPSTYTAGNPGGTGGSSQFGSWVTAAGGGGGAGDSGGGAQAGAPGQYIEYTINADTTPNAPLKNTQIQIFVGSGGSAGTGGGNWPQGGSGSSGSSGYVTVKVE
jgi:hypothetical protein